MPEPRSTGSGETANDQTTTVGGTAPMFWLTPYEIHVGIMHSQSHAEYTPGLPLAFVAMTDRQPYGLAGSRAIAVYSVSCSLFRII
jgi:hypothetical protein